MIALWLHWLISSTDVAVAMKTVGAKGHYSRKKVTLFPYPTKEGIRPKSVSIEQFEVSTGDHEHQLPHTFYTGISSLGKFREDCLYCLIFSQYWSIRRLIGLQPSFGHLHFAQMAVIHNKDELKCILLTIGHRHRTPKVNITVPPSIDFPRLIST